jgi:hypothetical protein
MELDDNTFLERFARRELKPEDFDHRGHLRMAWLHLSRYGQEEAASRVCRGIKELAALFGAPEKFNHALTEALLRIMARRMKESVAHDFRQFLAANPDLVADARAVLARYYSDELLYSPAAARGWVEPDRRPIE